MGKDPSRREFRKGGDCLEGDGSSRLGLGGVVIVADVRGPAVFVGRRGRRGRNGRERVHRRHADRHVRRRRRRSWAAEHPGGDAREVRADPLGPTRGSVRDHRRVLAAAAPKRRGEWLRCGHGNAPGQDLQGEPGAARRVVRDVRRRPDAGPRASRAAAQRPPRVLDGVAGLRAVETGARARARVTP